MPGDAPEQSSSKHCSNSQVKTIDSPPPSSSAGKDNASRTSDVAVLIKREPESLPEPEEPPPSPPRVIPETTPHSKTESHGELKRRLSSKTVKTDSSSSKWSGAEDELTLTAYDVIAGVINTRSIQPLEQDVDSVHTKVSSASPPSKKGRENAIHSITPTVSNSTATSTTSACSISSLSKKKDSLVKDLNEFSKVMHQVAQEQIEKERRVSLGTELEAPVYLSPSNGLPYHGIGQSHPNENYRQKYFQLQAAPSNRSQVNATYPPKSAAKSQLVLSGLNDPPVSNGNHLPATPTTPLEHFSTFQSSHLPLAANGSPVLHSPQHPLHPHLANGSPVLHSPQACPPPPPYSSTATGMCYPFNTTYQTACSSVGEQWPHLSQQALQLAQHTIDMQESRKDAISARVSSSVVALAGQKRPGCEMNNLPPAKLALLGHPLPPHSNTSASLHRYPVHIASPYPPYPGASSFPL